MVMGSSFEEASAVEVDHHRTTGGEVSGVHGQIQTVLHVFR